MDAWMWPVVARAAMSASESKKTERPSGVECASVVRTVFHLSLRATQGYLESVVRLMGVDPPVPAYSTVCRRQAGTLLSQIAWRSAALLSQFALQTAVACSNLISSNLNYLILPVIRDYAIADFDKQIG